MKSRIVGLSVLSVVVAVATLAVGCSSSSSKSSNTIRIGLEAPITGSLSELGQGMLNGAKQAATQVNANGGVNGKKIEIVAIDDKGDVDAGVTAANAAVKAGLDAVVGPYNSGWVSRHFRFTPLPVLFRFDSRHLTQQRAWGSHFSR